MGWRGLTAPAPVHTSPSWLNHYAAAGRRSADKAIDYAVLAGERAAGQFADQGSRGPLPRKLSTSCGARQRRGPGDANAMGSLPRGKSAKRTAAQATQQPRSRCCTMPQRAPKPRDGPTCSRGPPWPTAAGWPGTGMQRRSTDPAVFGDAPTGCPTEPTRRRRIPACGSSGGWRPPGSPHHRRRTQRLALAREAMDITGEHRRPGRTGDRDRGLLRRHRGPGHGSQSSSSPPSCIVALACMGTCDPKIVYAGHQHRLTTLMVLGDRVAADAEATVVTRFVTELRQPAQLWEQATFATALALLEGRFAEAAGSDRDKHRRARARLDELERLRQ